MSGVNNFLTLQPGVPNRNSHTSSQVRSLTDRDTISEKSSCLKKRVNNAMYSAFPELKEELFKELGETQARAQLDALKRFITTMEVEAVSAKRTAQETRFLNQKFDKKTRETSLNKSKLAREIKKHVMEQINDKKEKSIKKRETDRAVPDIEGDMGYPPRP